VTQLKLRHQWQLLITVAKVVIVKENIELQMWTYKRKYKHKPVTKLKLRHQWQLLKTKLVILKENVELQMWTYKRKYKHNPDFPPSYRL